eukprot:5825818-Pleurochrysis_carterae.AAC.1
MYRQSSLQPIGSAVDLALIWHTRLPCQLGRLFLVPPGRARRHAGLRWLRDRPRLQEPVPQPLLGARFATHASRTTRARLPVLWRLRDEGGVRRGSFSVVKAKGPLGYSLSV